MSPDIVRLLDESAAHLARAGVVHALIGGCARNAYAEPRATTDVDYAVALDAQRWQALRDALASGGFSLANEVRCQLGTSQRSRARTGRTLRS